MAAPSSARRSSSCTPAPGARLSSAGEAAKAAARVRALARGAALAAALGLEVHAGHGLDFETAGAIAAIPEIVELNIGHFLIGEAIFVGLAKPCGGCARRWTRGRARGERRR